MCDVFQAEVILWFWEVLHCSYRRQWQCPVRLSCTSQGFLKSSALIYPVSSLYNLYSHFLTAQSRGKKHVSPSFLSHSVSGTLEGHLQTSCGPCCFFYFLFSISTWCIIFCTKGNNNKIKFFTVFLFFKSIVSGGKCNTVLVANICGEALHVEETVSRAYFCRIEVFFTLLLQLCWP